MNILHAYACSHGKYGTVATDIPGLKPHDWEDENSFLYIVAKNLNYKLSNNSVPGASNFTIFKNMWKDIIHNKFNVNDIVILQWSHIDRVYVSSGKKTLMPFNQEEEAKIYYSTFYDAFQSLSIMVGYTNLLKKHLKAHLFYSSADYLDNLAKISPELTNSFIDSPNFVSHENMTPREYISKQPIEREMLFTPNCYHSSLLGHQVIAGLYLDKIKNFIQ